ncbi:MAG: collagen-like protein [Flavobacteriaceae bacterium]|nr:collagen-like protein [Flavobacteriaceae bacterium]
MKNILLLLAIGSSVIFSSCEGDPGPPGPPGEPGINILGQVFEARVDFTEANDFQVLVDIPANVEVFESDAILVYWLEDVVPDGSGGSIDVWSPLPQTIYVEGGSFQYTFNHTFIDVLLLLQGDIDLGTLGNGFRIDQIFRIAVVPAEFADANFSMDYLMNSGDFVFLDN